jgi:hypothetical protein
MHDSGKPAPDSVLDDIPTVCALAVIAVTITTAAHEALGHGSACLLLGGQITQLTSVYFQCSLHSSLIAPAGPLGNIVAGILAWVVQMALPRRASRARLLALLVMAFSLFWEAGYLLASMIVGRGDYAVVGQELLGSPQWPWRVSGILAGLLLYMLFARVLGICTHSYTTSVGRVPLLLGTAWLAGMFAVGAAALLYAPDRGAAYGRAACEIASAFPLLYPFNRIMATDHNAAPAIERSPAWIGVAIVVYAVFAATLGRGLPQ